MTVRHGTIFDTDSPDERRDAFHDERCPECDAVIAAVIDEAVAAFQADKERLDWLQDEVNPIDTIYFDDGEIMDVGGKHGGRLREAIDVARAARGEKAKEQR